MKQKPLIISLIVIIVICIGVILYFTVFQNIEIGKKDEIPKENKSYVCEKELETTGSYDLKNIYVQVLYYDDENFITSYDEKTILKFNKQNEYQEYQKSYNDEVDAIFDDNSLIVEIYRFKNNHIKDESGNDSKMHLETYIENMNNTGYNCKEG